MPSTAVTVEAEPAPWHAAYPAPKSNVAAISREDVLGLLRGGKDIAGRDFVLVDLRQNDHEVGQVVMTH